MKETNYIKKAKKVVREIILKNFMKSDVKIKFYTKYQLQKDKKRCSVIRDLYLKNKKDYFLRSEWGVNKDEVDECIYVIDNRERSFRIIFSEMRKKIREKFYI